MNVSLTTALMIYLVSWVIILLVFLRIGIAGISSIVLSLVVSFVILNIVLPPSQISPFASTSSGAVAYYLIEIVTPLIILIYTVIVAWHDRRFESVYCTK